MNIIAVDDEPIALEEMKFLLQNFADFQQIELFRSPQVALEWLKNNRADIAFLDIHMKRMDGLTLARYIKELVPDCAIVFVTGYSEYALQAIQMHASGYLMKPVQEADIQRELEHILHPPAPKVPKWRIRIQCFGSFEVFLDGIPMKFQYSKTKELLAYLVDRRGAGCTNGELMAVLWEGQADMLRRKSYLSNLSSDLAATFDAGGCGDVIFKRRGQLAIIPERISCDYYDWIGGEICAVNAYRGEYMSQYSWGEFTLGEIVSINKSSC